MTATLIPTTSSHAHPNPYRHAPANRTFGQDWPFIAVGYGMTPTATPFAAEEINDVTPSWFLTSPRIDSEWLNEGIQEGARESSAETDSSTTGRAVADLKSWLSVNDQELADLIGVSRRSVINWRAGKGTYSSTTRNLLGLHALVKQLRVQIGPERTIVWLLTPEKGISPLEELRADPECIPVLVARATPLLFPSGRGLPFRLDETEEQELLAALLPTDSEHAPRRPAHRTRRAPRSRQQ